MAEKKTARQRSEERLARKEMAGIPDSRPFAQTGNDPYAHLRELHVGGMRVGDLPEDVIARMSYDHTDEGIEERNAGKKEGAAREISGPREKKIAQRRDHLGNDSLEPWMAPDPLKQLADEHTTPGFSPKFLSPDLIKRKGTRGFQPVIKNGEPVKMGELILAQMPIEQVQQRNRKYRELSNQAQREVSQNFAEQRGGRASDFDDDVPSNRQGRALPVLGDGLQNDRGFAAHDD